MSTYLSQALKSSEIKSLFVEMFKENPKAKEKLLEKLANVCLDKPHFIDKSIYEKNKDDVRQDFLLKILENKLKKIDSLKNYQSYILTVVNNLWRDVLRKNRKSPKLLQDTDDISTPHLQSEPKDNPKIKLKTEYLEKIQSLPTFSRCILKLWRPYLFDSLEQDEIDYLAKSNPEIPCCLKEFKNLTEEVCENSKAYIPTKTIAKYLNTSPNNVDQALSRLRKKLPWLKNLKNAVKDSNID